MHNFSLPKHCLKMNYQTFPPQTDLGALVKCYWTLEVPAGHSPERQRIIPDGCIEMAFVLGEDIKRYTSGDDYILQPRAMVIGQLTEPFYIEPTGYVHTFAVRFYPYGFANFVPVPIQNLANRETPLEELFGKEVATGLEQKIAAAGDTQQRIQLIEDFLSCRFNEKATIDSLVKRTVEAMLSSNGSQAIRGIIQDDLARRRKLERRFRKQIGISPKQLGKIIRIQAALRMILHRSDESLTQIAYGSDYYDQAHFIKDFREFTGISPGQFFADKSMLLSSRFYTQD